MANNSYFSIPIHTTSLDNDRQREIQLNKNELKKLDKRDFSDISSRVIKTRELLNKLQNELQKDHCNNELIDEERAVNKHFTKLLNWEENMIRQKSRATWIALGDRNTKYFHRCMKQRASKKRIVRLKFNDIMIEDPEMLKVEILNHYKYFFGDSMTNRRSVKPTVFDQGPLVNNEENLMLNSPVSDDEVRRAMFSIDMDKAPGPDGFGSAFFRKSWNIVGGDIIKAVKDFFTTGKMLRQANATIVSLIPKVDNPEIISEFRPIACCNTMYKVISKILAKRMSSILSRIVSSSQSAFVPGRSIADNILLAHELVRNYHRQNGRSCAMKVDLQKAYDTVEWDFIEEVLLGLRFERRFIKLIMECIKSAKFSILVNGESCGYFQSARGLRQGDPISPLIFILCMEYLSRSLALNIMEGTGFKFHKSCNKIRLCHLAFADDLFLFSNGDMSSIAILKNTMMDFSLSSGLPLMSSKLTKEMCKGLIDRIAKKISTWTSKCLSYAERLQLINSVLLSMHIYWCSVFILPKSVIYGVEEKCRRYLWHGNTEKKGSNIRWDVVCSTAVTKNVWNIVSFKPSLWAKWVTIKKLRLSSFWGIAKPLDSSWSWRNILKIRHLVGHLFDYRLGDGKKFFFWGDPWVNGMYISDRFPGIDIKDSNIKKATKICNLWKNGRWHLPDPMDETTNSAWGYIKENFRIRNGIEDLVSNKARKDGKFTIRSVWQKLIPEGNMVNWSHLIWYPGNIPRCSFITWIALHNRLMTKDKLKRWNIINEDTCSMCNGHRESRNHLLFECIFSKDVWKRVLEMLRINRNGFNWNREVVFFTRRACGRSEEAKKRRRAFTATVYCIWKARNEMVFNAKMTRVEDCFKSISVLVSAAAELFCWFIASLALLLCAFVSTSEDGELERVSESADVELLN
ncbi:uncharacterized protein LOC130015686 [Mercurialis annua]|uniref:uncharacterized protein LOC130015686 n=1 Tax=Mercurialis annua TaxID=3986 RepID=UPI0024AC98D1|nr:uncharacterized protein LOC130015686 [Mercurialis annua]